MSYRIADANFVPWHSLLSSLVYHINCPRYGHVGSFVEHGTNYFILKSDVDTRTRIYVGFGRLNRHKFTLAY
jgi:hypothetical protein